MIIRDLRGIESTQEACARIRVYMHILVNMSIFVSCLKLLLSNSVYVYTFGPLNSLIFLPSNFHQKSKDHRKGPVIILNITYKGVKFVDAATKVKASSLTKVNTGLP